MSTLSLRLPESLHRSVGELARQEGISMNQFIATAVAEKLAALSTADYLQSRARRGNRKAFERVLANVPRSEPESKDRLHGESKLDRASARTRSARR